MKYDREFHRCMIENCKNSKLRFMIQQINHQIERITNLISTDPKRAAIALEEHTNILNAVENRAAAKAEELMRNHIKDSKEYHLRNLDYLLSKMR